MTLLNVFVPGVPIHETATLWGVLDNVNLGLILPSAN